MDREVGGSGLGKTFGSYLRVRTDHELLSFATRKTVDAPSAKGDFFSDRLVKRRPVLGRSVTTPETLKVG